MPSASFTWPRLAAALLLAATALPALAFQAATPSASYYPVRLDDPQAVYLAPGTAGLIGDGRADDTDALQRAIDKVQDTTRQGIVFLASGTYRITHTLYVWPAVRILGYGPTRPVLTLADNTPGYQQSIGYMMFFTGGRPGHDPERPGRARTSNRRQPSGPFPGTVPPLADVTDANPGTFYSAISNIDFEIGSGNPQAVGIRFHVAQHCFLTHMDFRLKSGLAALHDIGNEAEDLHFYGGRYGIMTRKPSPGWQFTLIDSSFEGQTEAAIKEHEAGLTLIHDSFRNLPAAISIDPGYSEELWVKRSRFENITGPLVTISNENSPRTEINMEDLLCRHVASFAAFRESGKKIDSPADAYHVTAFSHGLAIGDTVAQAETRTDFQAAPLSDFPAADHNAIAAPPTHTQWANLRALGAKGDGVTNDTAAIQKAIDTHRILYVPSGRYLVSDTIRLRPDTILIGLHPSTTQFDLADSTPGFDGAGPPKALLLAPHGGTNIVSGIGLYTGGVNSLAIGALWMAGKDSLLDDVRFLGGHGTNNPDGSRSNPYNNTHTADPDLARRWDGQYPSLWVANGGGGTFANIWTPNTFAQAGLYVSDTDTEGHVYELSSEHHVRNEVKLHRAANWELFALQTEEERGEGPFALPLEIADSHHITIANYHSYRVVSSYQPYPYAIRISNSHDLRFRNIHVYSDSRASFDSSLYDLGHDAQLRYREFATLTVTEANPLHPVPVTRGVEKLAGGFYNIAGSAVDGSGRLYFTDPHWQHIYRWTPATRVLDTVRDNPIDATNLAVDKSGNLLALSYAGNGTVYAFKPDEPATSITLLKPEPAAERPGMTALLPTDYWRNENDFLEAAPIRKPWQYVSPDRSIFIPAGQDFTTGALYYGTKMADVLRAFGLGAATPGKPFYVTSESDQRTWSAQVSADGTLKDLKLFADRGGESVTSDADGNVYIADGEVFVYSPDGKLKETIHTPERPTNLIFGGDRRKTLFILARTSLYALEVK